MPKIPINMNTTAYKVESIVHEQEPRGYLGMSGLGHPCSRTLWYGFHFVSKRESITARMKRLFNRGHQEEPVIISDLKSAGIEVFKVINEEEVEMTGEKDEDQEELIGFAGHAKGHPDGRVRGLPEAPKTVHLLEMKTASDAQFKKIKKLGVKKAKPVYYSQAQRYMDKMGLTRALFVVTNKNNDERHYERVKIDKDYAEILAKKEQDIILAEAPPPKISENRNWIDCKYCNHKDVCHGGQQPERNCRTCNHADIADNGRWECNMHQRDLTLDEQIKGCEFWSQGWGL